MSQGWKPIGTAPENRMVLTRIYDEEAGTRNVQPMMLRGNLWWINVGEPGEMYVYYSPTHWMEL